MRAYYDHGGITIYHGDCRELLARVTDGSEVCVSDPPYGMRRHGQYQRGRNGSGKAGVTGHYNVRIHGDDQAFDPSPLLVFRGVALWGFQHFAARLPVGRVLVWIKRYDSGYGSFLSDAELAWVKGGCGVYCRRDVSLQGDARVHPTQKPIGIMAWCVEAAGAGVVVDPYAGSGSTLIAAKRLGRRAIGIEIEEKYCAIAADRLSQDVLPLDAVGA